MAPDIAQPIEKPSGDSKGAADESWLRPVVSLSRWLWAASELPRVSWGMSGDRGDGLLRSELLGGTGGMTRWSFTIMVSQIF